MASKVVSRTRNPKQSAKKPVLADWSALQATYKFEGTVLEQLKSGHRKALLKAFQYSQRAGVLPGWMLVLYGAMEAGYLEGQRSERVGGRLPKRLIAAAKKKSGIESQSELLEYALSKVALEDDYGKKLVSLKGSIPDDVEF